jgi:hypothetical protein
MLDHPGTHSVGGLSKPARNSPFAMKRCFATGLRHSTFSSVAKFLLNGKAVRRPTRAEEEINQQIIEYNSHGHISTLLHVGNPQMTRIVYYWSLHPGPCSVEHEESDIQRLVSSMVHLGTKADPIGFSGCDLASATHIVAECRHYSPTGAVNHSCQSERQISFLKG